MPALLQDPNGQQREGRVTNQPRYRERFEPLDFQKVPEDGLRKASSDVCFEQIKASVKKEECEDTFRQYAYIEESSCMKKTCEGSLDVICM